MTAAAVSGHAGFEIARRPGEIADLTFASPRAEFRIPGDEHLRIIIRITVLRHESRYSARAQTVSADSG